MVSHKNESLMQAKSLAISTRCIIAGNGVILLCLAIHRAIVINNEAAGLSGLGLVRILIRDQAIYLIV